MTLPPGGCPPQPSTRVAPSEPGMASGRLMPEDIVERLEQAGATLLAMQISAGAPSGMHAAWPEYVRAAAEAYGYNQATMKPAIPDSATITAMEETYGWVRIIPKERYVIRRIVMMRSLVFPISWRYVFKWTKIARTVGCDYRAIKGWHSDGINLIAVGLEQKSLAKHVGSGASSRSN